MPVSILIENFGAGLLQSHLHRRNPWLKTPAEILQALPFVISSDALYKKKLLYIKISWLWTLENALKTLDAFVFKVEWKTLLN